ncbi:MAG: hypothetical protein JWO42_2828 [Chloroflexi bacterium]|nr:hypothetical protein [Chloroflexota bacterium]
MPAEQRRMVFLLSIAAAVVFVIIGILYLAGDFIPSGVHHKHAILAFVLAAASLVLANFNRAGTAARR